MPELSLIMTKLQKLSSFRNKIQKAKKYLKSGEYPPRGRKLHIGPNKGRYYLTGPVEPGKKNQYPNDLTRMISIQPVHLSINQKEQAEVTIDYQKIHEKIHPYYFQYRTDLTSDEIKALLSYQDDSSIINQYLRRQIQTSHGFSHKIKEPIGNIKRAFSKPDSVLSSPMFLFKGISSDFAKRVIQEGYIRDQGFFSSSYNPQIAIRYARKSDITRNISDQDRFRNVLITKFSKGPAINMGYQNEILLPSGTEWTLSEIREYNHFSTNIPQYHSRKIFKKIRFLFIDQINGGEL